MNASGCPWKLLVRCSGMRSPASKITRRERTISFGILLSTGMLMVMGTLLFREERGKDKAYSEAAILFDICGFATKAACTADASCTSGGVPSGCYQSVSNGWCCPRGCTLEQRCGDAQITGNEECDAGGDCNVGGTARTLHDVQKCIAKGGMSTAVEGDGDSCDVACVSEIATCGGGQNICDTAQGENCRTCRVDCPCTGGALCDLSGACVIRAGGGFCGDGITQAVEQCDDSNLVDLDGCSALCVCEGCGDGYKCGAEQCDDGNTTPNDGCSGTCVIEPTCTDGIKNQGEKEIDCGGPCSACTCAKNADCDDDLYCTVDTCVASSCVYTAFDADTGGANTGPCAADFSFICTVPSRCTCNENTNGCDLFKNTSNGLFTTEASCTSASNTLCIESGDPNGCYLKAAGSWACPGRE